MTTNAHGQARDDGTDGSLQSLTFRLENKTAFTDFEFNVRIPNNTNPHPTLTMTVFDVQGGVLVTQAYTLGNGQNYFAVSAVNGIAIREITLTANSDVVSQFQQFRVSVLAVSEPSALVVVGLVATLCTFRRRRSR